MDFSVPKMEIISQPKPYCHHGSTEYPAGTVAKCGGCGHTLILDDDQRDGKFWRDRTRKEKGDE